MTSALSGTLITLSTNCYLHRVAVPPTSPLSPASFPPPHIASASPSPCSRHLSSHCSLSSVLSSILSAPTYFCFHPFPSLTLCLLTTAFHQPVQCTLASTSPCPRLLSSYCLLHRVVSVSSAASCPPPRCSSAVALPSSPFLSLPPPSPGLNMLPLADLSSPPLSSLWGLCHHAQASVKRRVRLGNATHIHGS